MTERRVHRVVYIPGDGIGPEIMGAVRAVLDATGVPIEWQRAEMGEAAIVKSGDPLPPVTLDVIRACGVAIKGPTATPVGGGFRSVNVQLRRELDLYANVRPIRPIANVRHRHAETFANVNAVIIRENTEDLYAGIEADGGTQFARDLIAVAREHGRHIPDDAILALKFFTPGATERIIRFAFQYTRDFGNRGGNGRVTLVHKANIFKDTDGCYLRAFERVAKEFPDLHADTLIVDNATKELVMRPEAYGVLVAPNLYGDILSDLGAGLVGGLGLAPGANIGDTCRVYEAVHGTAPDIAGKDLANPLALLRSAVMMLRDLGETVSADHIASAVQHVIANGRAITADLHPKDHPPVGTAAMGEAIAARVHFLHTASRP